MSKLTRVSATLLALFAWPALASADDGFYIGVGAGSSAIDSDLDVATIGGFPIRIDDDETATKIFAGYTFDLTALEIGVELGYVDLGEPEVEALGSVFVLDTTGVNLWGIAALDTGPFDIYGKLGWVAWDAETRFDANRFSEDGSDLAYGAGIRFGFGSLEFRGEYEVYDLEDTDVSMLSVGVAYYFD